MKHNFQDLTGQKFNKLTVLKLDLTKTNRPYWVCRCDCGNMVSVRADLLKSGNTKACGCLYNKHNQALQGNHSRIYSIYHDIKKRCYNPKSKSYKYYGAKGITMCDEWLGEKGFENFYKWSLSHGYSDLLSIDRIDPSLPYSPDNCRWVKWGVQANNKSNNLKITYNGQTQSLAAWCRELNLNYSKVRQRIYHGKPFELAIIGAEL
jgi:hypothetical protein